MAPEVIQEEKYDNKCDIWSLGVIAYELLTTKLPFQAKSQMALMNKIINGNYNPLPDKIPNLFSELIPQMLTTDPAKRPCIEDIISKLPKSKASESPSKALLSDQLDKREEEETQEESPYLKKARDLMEQGRIQEAVDYLFRVAVKLNSNWQTYNDYPLEEYRIDHFHALDLFWESAEIWMKVGEVEKAVEQYFKIADEVPGGSAGTVFWRDTCTAFEKAAKCWTRVGNIEKAIQVCI